MSALAVMRVLYLLLGLPGVPEHLLQQVGVTGLPAVLAAGPARGSGAAGRV